MITKTTKFIFFLFFIIEFTSIVNAQYTFPQILQTTPLADLQEFQVIDFNNDGFNDIVAKTGPQGGSYIHFIKGSTEGYTVEKSIQFQNFISQMVFFDFDKDGDLDLFSNYIVYENQDLEFTERSQLDGIGFSDILIYDMDDDGWDDIVPGIWHLDDNQSSFPFYKNTGEFNFELVGDVPSLTNAGKIMMLDINKDGKNEIVILNTNEPNFFTLLGGNHVEPFEYNGDYPKPTFRDIYIADIDGDGWDEIINHGSSFTDIFIYFFEENTFKPVLYNSNEFATGLLIHDHNGDGIDDIIGYGHDYQFIRYDDGQLVLDKIIPGPEAPQTYLESKIIYKDSEAILLRSRFNALYVFDLENENLSNGYSIVDDISQNRAITPVTSDNSDLGYSFIEENNIKVLRLDPISKQKKYETIPLKNKPYSVSLTELEPNAPVYILTYFNDNGIYIFDANNPTEEEINNPKFTLSSNAISLYTKEADNQISVLINDDFDIYRLSFDSDYKLDYLRNMNNLPIELIEVDINHDQQKEIVWKSNYAIWFSKKEQNTYTDFVKLEFEQNLPLGNSLFYDYDGDGEIEIVTSQYEKIIILEVDDAYQATKTELDSENLLYFNATGSLGQGYISLIKSDGRIQIIEDLQSYLSTHEIEIDLDIEPHLAGLAFFQDLDSDNDLDILIRNRFFVSTSLNGDILSTSNTEEQLHVYPNPTFGAFHVNTEEDYKILSIQSINGVQFPITSDMNQFPNGIYSITILINQRLKTFQIIKTD
ncbi:MAG: T9SS type A sorting domain-containing protein [Saprospiraceae bacterium]|nr:T9SS type A sorting domain-containing protein [Saprospiraceae bacterium]